MFARLRALLPAWRRALRRRRRTLAVLALAAMVAALLPSLLPPSLRGSEVVVAHSDLPAGTVLTLEHLRTLRIAEELVPEQAVRSAQDLAGRTIAHPLADGTPILPGMLEDEGPAAVPEGAVLMAVPVQTVLVPHLGPGTRIELLALELTTGDHARVPATVVELSTHSGGAAGALGAGGERTAQAIIAIDRTRSGEVAHALGAGALTISIIG